MNKKKLIILSTSFWSEDYLRDSIVPSKIKYFDLIIEKKNKKVTDFIKINNINCKIYIKNKITAQWFKKTFDTKNSLLLSAGSPWIIDKQIIKLFKNDIINVHQSPLPSFRGAVASYVRLFELRALQTCLHVVKTKLDQGPIVFQKDIFIDKSYDTPLKINNYLQIKNREIIREFLYSYFILKKKLTYSKQNDYFSSYMPRLKSKINGWIDWSLNSYELDRFIGAFDDPYPGARTMLHGKEVCFFDAQISCLDSSKHPFENGMVLRKFADRLVISVNGGSLYVKKIMLKNKNIIDSIKPGDIFYTNLNKLDLTNRRNIFVVNKKILTNQLKIKKI